MKTSVNLRPIGPLQKQVARRLGLAAKAELVEILGPTPARTGLTRGGHTASAPGEAPAKKTGKLQRSAYFKVRKRARGHVVEVGTNDPKSSELEFGTEKIAPRPFMAKLIAPARMKNVIRRAGNGA